MPDARIAYQPFEQQAAFFRRKVNVPSARWDDLLREDHAHGFMVAGLARMDVLEDMRQAIRDAIEKGETLADFRARFDQIVQGRWEGWTGSSTAAGRAWRTRIIYQTNLRTSYMAGRWEQLQKFPYLRYQHNTIANPREQHKAWDDLILRSDHPWWSVNYPPNGWGCRCTVTGVSAARLRVLGRTPDKAPDVGDETPPEWAYHVGKAARSLPAAVAFGEKVMQLPPAWRTKALEDAQRRRVDWLLDWPATTARLAFDLDNGLRSIGVASPVAFLNPATIEAMRAEPSTALIAINAQAMRQMLDSEQLADLPDLINEAPIILQAPNRKSLKFATPEAGQYRTIRVNLDATRQQTRANWVGTMALESRADLADWTVLQGEL
jgi:hypothetical protein